MKLRTYFFLQNFPHQKLVLKCINVNLKMLTETRQNGCFSYLFNIIGKIKNFNIEVTDLIFLQIVRHEKVE